MNFIIPENAVHEIDRNRLLKNRLERCINKACDKLYLKDYSLILRGEEHVSERSIVFRFGLYLEDSLSRDEILSRYDLDCEYNRNGQGRKTLPSWVNGCFPDLIIHKRGHNYDNLLIIECKAWFNKHGATDDLIKIKEFIESDVYHYMHGLQIIFEKEHDEAILKWFSSGRK